MYNIVQPEGEKYYKIGDLASKLGTTQRALRFYEKKGLISSKRQGLHRLYTTRDRSRLELILKAKQLGFTLAEIRDMISDQANEPQFSPSLHIIDEQISMLNRRLAEIESAKLVSKAVQCHPLSLGFVSVIQREASFRIQARPLQSSLTGGEAGGDEQGTADGKAASHVERQNGCDAHSARTPL